MVARISFVGTGSRTPTLIFHMKEAGTKMKNLHRVEPRNASTTSLHLTSLM